MDSRWHRSAVRGQSMELMSIAVSPHGQALACSSRRSFHVWGVREALPGSIIPIWSKSMEYVHVAFPPDGRFLAHFLKKKNKRTILVFDTESQTIEHSIEPTEANQITRVCFSSDGQMLACSTYFYPGHPAGLEVWDLRDSHHGPLHTFRTHGSTSPVIALGFAPGNRYLVATTKDRIAVHDLIIRKNLRTRTTNHQIQNIRFTSHGDRILTEWGSLPTIPQDLVEEPSVEFQKEYPSLLTKRDNWVVHGSPEASLVTTELPGCLGLR
ncbi:WD40 repeat-like protein [Penicillium malachiteum]|uniref:WD40 repeat-like protein n=1 Tax=Penicillium malachiteum TaxID=1324776 RepID=A0AAD6HX41_9EURO|nr:WD40 repeat-like protein [Penicillium malachiteum]